MNRIDASLHEMERAKIHRQVYQDPFKWGGKWIVGKAVYVVYAALLLALYVWYHYFFIPWREK